MAIKQPLRNILEIIANLSHNDFNTNVFHTVVVDQHFQYHHHKMLNRKIRRKYKIYKQERGAEIKDIFYITRDEPFPHMYENADFSPKIIKDSIKEVQMKTNEILEERLSGE